MGSQRVGHDWATNKTGLVGGCGRVIETFNMDSVYIFICTYMLLKTEYIKFISRNINNDNCLWWNKKYSNTSISGIQWGYSVEKILTVNRRKQRYCSS